MRRLAVGPDRALAVGGWVLAFLIPDSNPKLSVRDRSGKTPGEAPIPITIGTN